MLITNKIKFTRSEITFLGERLEYKKAFTYLGVLLDHKFTWQPHIKEVLKKSEGIINTFSRVAVLKWGLKSNVIRTIYEGAK